MIMKKFVLVGFVCGLVGFVLGNAFWYLASPLWIDREVSETLHRTEATRVLATGQFAGADAVHQGSGKAELIDTGTGAIVRFTDFEVTDPSDYKTVVVWCKRFGVLFAAAEF